MKPKAIETIYSEKEWVVFDSDTGTLLGWVYSETQKDAYDIASDTWNLPLDDLDVYLSVAEERRQRAKKKGRTYAYNGN